jgi:hypothetical protein
MIDEWIQIVRSYMCLAEVGLRPVSWFVLILGGDQVFVAEDFTIKRLLFAEDVSAHLLRRIPDLIDRLTTFGFSARDTSLGSIVITKQLRT